MAKPTRPVVPITVDGVEYKLYFDLNAIADAEERLAAKGVTVNLVGAKWGELTASSTRALFIAGLKVHQPDIKEDEARALYGLAASEDVVIAIAKGYKNFSPEEEEVKEGSGDPLQPGS